MRIRMPQAWLKTRCYDSLEELDFRGLVVPVENFRGPARVRVPLDDDRQEGSEHDHGLEGVGPHHSLDPTDGRVKDADDEDDQAGSVQVESSDWKE